MSSSAEHRQLGVAALTSALGVVAVALFLSLPEATAHPRPLPWWLLIVGFAAAEAVVVHLQVRRDSVSVSFGEIPLVLGLAFTAPSGLVLASVTGSAVVLLLQRGQRGWKLAFNLALFAVEASLACTVYLAISGDAAPASVLAGVATLLAVVSADVASALAVTAVICLSTGRIDREPLLETVSTGLVGAVANSSAALLAVVLVVRQPPALALLLVVLGAMAVVYRAYAVLGRGHIRLELLYRFTRGIAEQGEIDQVASRVLSEARDVMQSGRADLMLLGTASRPEVVLRLDDADDVPAAAVGERWWSDVVDGHAVRWPRGSESPSGLRAAGLDDGLAAPLQVGREVFGVLAVGGRPSFLASYSADDLRLFQSLADHAAVALRNVALVEELRGEVAERQHQALHDPGTGLPNRRRFLDRVDVELQARRPFAVVMLDLVGFGQVNDALGYGTGDQLLADVGQRLAGQLGVEQVARLGNDEYAAVLLDTPDETSALQRTNEVLRSLDAPFPVTGFSLDIRARAGVAVSPVHGEKSTQLLQRANAALSSAERDGTALSVYSIWQDQSSARRLQLVSDLRGAVSRAELQVHYQPKVEPATGRPCSAEALVRWTHPQLGRIGPDEFIPLAEHSGLIGDLTSLVLRQALRECARWRADGHPMGIAVNLSTRSLTDLELPGRVATELLTAGLPAHAVTLEVTESAVMTDVQRSLDVLHRLRALGVSLSVDDFGTGQSSLAYLQDLPVQELKIDKSFVRGVVARPATMAIVQGTIDLAHALALTVVAEGVEDEATRHRLAAAGCDVLQGYLFSRPLPSEQFAEWLSARRAPASC